MFIITHNVAFRTCLVQLKLILKNFSHSSIVIITCSKSLDIGLILNEVIYISFSLDKRIKTLFVSNVNRRRVF